MDVGYKIDSVKGMKMINWFLCKIEKLGSSGGRTKKN
jgi:hypothetical protein